MEDDEQVSLPYGFIIYHPPWKETPEIIFEDDYDLRHGELDADIRKAT